MVEVLVAFTVLVVSVGAIVGALVTALETQRMSQETRRAVIAAESVLEELKAADFAQVFVLYNADPLDDPVGPAPGASFAVRGLTALPGDADGLPGEIIFPVNGTELREDGVDSALGLPRDLDGDGAIDAADHSGNYALLPVMIRVRWSGVSRAREIRLVTTLTDL